MADKPVKCLPDPTPAADYRGLKTGDQIKVRWMSGVDLMGAAVLATIGFGALVLADWEHGPFEMYVTQQCPDGAWCR